MRDLVVYAHLVIPLVVGLEKSIQAVESAMAADKEILLIAQKSATEDDPSADDLYRIGTLSTILQLLKLPDGTVKVLVEGVKRAKIVHFLPNEDYFTAQIAHLESEPLPEREAEV